MIVNMNKKRAIALISLLLGFLLPLGAQNLTVTGKVLDENGQPLPGAFLVCKGTSNGTATDGDGHFSIEVPTGAILVASYIGYCEKVVPVEGRSRLDIALEPDVLLMEKAVVVGYGTQKSKDLTAPVANVKGEDISRQVTANPMAALQGKIAGVQVINTGVPGGSPSVRIRGTGSIGDYAKPLYVVDGVFVDDIQFISNSDIQEMTVLKDASAAAIYGVRAANGVVIVTTKRGMTDQTEIRYDGYVGLQMPVNVMKLASAAQYVELLNEANASATGYVPKDLAAYPASTDWYAQLMRNALMHSHSLDVSRASGKTSASFGLNYFNQDGIMKAKNGYERVNIRIRVDQQINDWLSLGGNVLVSGNQTRSPDTGAYFQAFVNPPVYPVFDESNTDAYPVKFDAAQRYGFGNSYGNPYARAYYHDARSKGLSLILSIYGEMKFLRDRLKFRTAYNLDYNSFLCKNFTPEHYVGGSQGVSRSGLSKTFGIGSKHILDNTLTFADEVQRHRFSVLLGQSTRIESFSGMTGTASDVPDADEQAMYLGNGSTRNRSVTDLDPFPYRNHGLSFFTRGTYNYADRYLATLTMRADGSSKYNRKWGYFPSVGLGWVLTGEDFMRERRVFDYLKFRASWGLLGNDSVPANSSLILGASGYDSSGVFNDVLIDGIGAQTVYRNFLEWEVVNEYDFGADFAFLDSRLSGELDYYNRTTRNVVFHVPIATGGGTAELLANNGSVRNSGLELGLRWSDSLKKGLSYQVGLNLTTVRNRVISLNGREYIPGAKVRGNFATRTQVGYPIGTFWGYEIDGVYQKTGEALSDPVVQTIQDKGYFKYRDQNGDSKIDDQDKVSLGSPIPWLIGGLDFGFTWKRLDVHLSLQGQVGNKILNAKRMNRDVFADGNYDLDFYEHCWRPDRKSDRYPSPEAYNRAFTQQANDFFVEDGSYIRIQNIQIGYDFGRLGFVRDLRVYASAQRPFTYFTYKGFTTEVGGSPIATGIDSSTYPMQAICTLGLKLDF